MEIKINKKYKTTIFSQENEGLGVSKIDNMIVFVENGLKGDSGEVLITEIKKNFGRSKMVSFDKISEERVLPPCPYYGECGGCDLQHQGYKYQLAFKEGKVRTALERIGGFKDVLINRIISDNEYNYRNKVTLRINKDKLGFYKHNSNDIVVIEKCLIAHSEINGVIKDMCTFIKGHVDNSFNSLVIRYSEDGLMIKIDSIDTELSNELVSFLIGRVKDIKSIVLNDEVIYGNDYILEYIDDFKFKVSPVSFYQVNISIMNKMYNKVIEHASTIKDSTILDLYCGIGTITTLLSKTASRVIGIEVSSDSIKDAIKNIELNNIKNITFIEGKVENKIDALLEENVDTIVMDPPRSGIEKRTLDAIMKIEPKQIIYVSCNPVTLARDLKILGEKYMLNDVTPFDMFPQTSHVESVSLLSLR